MPNLPPPPTIDEIQARHKAATAGPWRVEEDDTCWMLFGRGRPFEGMGRMMTRGIDPQLIKAPKCNTPYAEYWPNKDDSAFLSHAHEDMRVLLEDRQRLLKVIESLSWPPSPEV